MPRVGLDREAVVEAAIALADRAGIEGLTIKSLAQKLGVQPPSLYNHVESLEALRRALALEGMRRLASDFAHATAGRSRDDAVRELARAYRAFARKHPGLYAASRVAPAKTDTEALHASARVVGVVVAVLSGYGLSDDDAIHATRALRAALHGFVDLETHGGFGLKTDVGASFERMIDLLTLGLRRVEQASPRA